MYHIKIRYRKRNLNILACYKPPNVDNDSFLDHLESKVTNIGCDEDLIIVGDLNMDWLSEKGLVLKRFCESNRLKNAVTKPTRIDLRQGDKRKFKSETLIDVILHNKETIKTTSVIDFPHSDHSLVIAYCNFDRIKVQ